jgi:iron(III) transport system substrate-binding protein
MNMLSKMKKGFLHLLVVSCVATLAACGSSASGEEEKVVISTNGDDEAVEAMETALKGAGYEGKYVLQSLGTSELGGKLLVEGEKTDSDLITMSSYYIESAQKKYDMFADLTFDPKALEETPAYYSPILSNTGSIFVNTEILKQKGLEMPTSMKDLVKPEYKNLVSIPNIMDSSTGWLLVQSIMSEYGEEEGKEILKQLISNVGPHLESSGSGPIKKVQAGEVAVGFGLRHQAVAAKENGEPIDFVDPTEGNFSLTESVAVVKKDEATTELAQEMAKVIIEDGREALIESYPVALYEGETVSESNKPAHSKTFSEPLTVDLLKEHQEFFKSAK